jgi:hypothetical protein
VPVGPGWVKKYQAPVGPARHLIGYGVRRDAPGTPAVSPTKLPQNVIKYMHFPLSSHLRGTLLQIPQHIFHLANIRPNPIYYFLLRPRFEAFNGFNDVVAEPRALISDGVAAAISISGSHMRLHLLNCSHAAILRDLTRKTSWQEYFGSAWPIAPASAD